MNNARLLLILPVIIIVDVLRDLVWIAAIGIIAAALLLCWWWWGRA